ncbi:MAG TPA: MurR/RpiR family transcriptional regulator, partial [Limnochordales bacterium]
MNEVALLGMETDPGQNGLRPDGDKRDLLRRLTTFRQSRASPTEQMVCDYLIASYRDAAFLTAEEIARAAGVSKATVIRLAPKIGFASFNDLRERLRRIVAYDLITADREEQGGGASHPGQRLVAAEVDNLRRLARQLSAEDLEQAARWLCDSRSVTVLGFRHSAALAVHAGYHLKKLLPHVYVYTAADSSLWEHLALVREGSVVLAIGLARRDRRFMEALEYARS